MSKAEKSIVAAHRSIKIHQKRNAGETRTQPTQTEHRKLLLLTDHVRKDTFQRGGDCVTEERIYCTKDLTSVYVKDRKTQMVESNIRSVPRRIGAMC